MARNDSAVDRAVNAQVEVVGAADHRQHLAGVGVQHDDGGVAHVVGYPVIVGVGQLRQSVAERAQRRILRVQVQRGIDLQALGVKRLQPELFLQLTAHVHHEVGRFDGEGDRGEAKFLLRCQVGLLLRDVAVLDHQSQHHALALFGGFGVLQRVIAGRRLREAGQQRTLGQIKFGGALGEVGTSSSLDAVGQVTVIGLVQVERQNLVLAVGSRQSPGQDGLTQFALQADLGALLG